MTTDIDDLAIRIDEANVSAAIREDVHDLLAELRSLREANRWVSVGEKLPEERTRVLVTNGDDFAVAFRVGERYYWPQMRVTHWKLPTPPEPNP